MQSGPYEYDVALSFVGENRDYVDEVASFLRSRDVHVFSSSTTNSSRIGFGATISTHTRTRSITARHASA
jgi:hypothetical protein